MILSPCTTPLIFTLTGLFAVAALLQLLEQAKVLNHKVDWERAR